MLSQNQVVKVKAAFALGYVGTMDVYEYVQTTGANHAQIATESKVQSAVPCRLSFSTSPVVSGVDVKEVAQTVKVFFDPSYSIKAGSKLVITQNGVTTAYKHSGIESVYDTHKEVILNLFDRWS